MLSGLIMKENLLSIRERQSGQKTAPWIYSQSSDRSGLWIFVGEEPITVVGMNLSITSRRTCTEDDQFVFLILTSTA